MNEIVILFPKSKIPSDSERFRVLINFKFSPQSVDLIFVYPRNNRKKAYFNYFSIRILKFLLSRFVFGFISNLWTPRIFDLENSKFVHGYHPCVSPCSPDSLWNRCFSVQSHTYTKPNIVGACCEPSTATKNSFFARNIALFVVSHVLYSRLVYKKYLKATVGPYGRASKSAQTYTIA